MKKTTKKTTPKEFDLEYLQRIHPDKAHARWMADEWRNYLEYKPLTHGEWLHRYIEDEIAKAINSGDAGFFRRFAKYIEKPKKPCPIRTWLLDVHIHNINGPLTRFTNRELVQGLKEAGFFRGMDDDSILTQLKRMMKDLNLNFKNSPKK